LGDHPVAHLGVRKHSTIKEDLVKRTTVVLLLFLALAPLTFASRFNSHYGPHPSRKSHVSGRGDGYYVEGHGRSHKGGHYSNRQTGNQYRDRKDGVK
jgi:hypothetical protein